MPDILPTTAEPNGAATPAEAAGFSISDPPPEKPAEAVARLAKLPRLDYDQQRAAEAGKLGVRVSTLDDAVACARGDGQVAEPGQGRPLRISRPDPWPHAVDGAELLNAISAFFSRHVFLPPGAADALAAWTVHTYCFSYFRHSPRLGFTSPEKRCGKTTALDALALLVCAPVTTANVTAAALFRTIELAAPTLLIDEADTFLRENEDLRGAINAGHKRGGQVIRCVGDDAEPRAFSVFAPAAIAAIGRLPGTIQDRALMVRMKRATRAERPAPFDAKAEVEAERLARMCARWIADHADKLPIFEPKLPPGLFNRAADNWRCLFAIAELAGGDWSARLTGASARLAPDDDDESRGIRLLDDIRAIFATRGTDRIASAELVEALVAIETSPWSDFSRGRPLTPAVLARMLGGFGLAPDTVRIGDRTPKGYYRHAFAEVWRRYLSDEPDTARPAEGGMEAQHRHNPQETTKNDVQEPQHGWADVAAHEREISWNSAACGGVADQDPIPGEPGDMWRAEP